MVIDPFAVRTVEPTSCSRYDTLAYEGGRDRLSRDPADGPAASTPFTAFGDIGGNRRGAADPSAGVQHLRSRAQTLTLFLEALAEDQASLEAAGVRTLVDTLHGQALRLQTRLENVLVATALRRGHLPLRPQVVDPAEILTELRPAVEPLLAANRQHLRLSTSALAPAGGGPFVAPAILADPLRLAQALLNLILNAGACSPPGSAVDVTVETAAATAIGEPAPGSDATAPLPCWSRVAVLDCGPRLPDESAGHAGCLGRFPYREAAAHAGGAAQALAREAALGLAVAQAIVAAHGGRLGAENRPGGGARYWLALPRLSHRGAPS
jgi:signal transduction histidine kinase